MRACVLAWLLWLGSAAAQAAGFDHGLWGGLLQAHVATISNGHATAVD